MTGERAKIMFRQGMAFLRAGKPRQAFPYFLMPGQTVQIRRVAGNCANELNAAAYHQPHRVLTTERRTATHIAYGFKGRARRRLMMLVLGKDYRRPKKPAVLEAEELRAAADPSVPFERPDDAPTPGNERRRFIKIVTK